MNIPCRNRKCDHNTPEHTCMYGVSENLVKAVLSGKKTCDHLKKGILELDEEFRKVYGVDKIVKRLEEESSFFEGKPMGTLQKHFYCEGIKRAIEIVRGGAK